MLKLSFHQHLAMLWTLGAPGCLAPVLRESTRQDAGKVLAWGVVIVAAMILFVPAVVRHPLLRRSLAWTDAMSVAQLRALKNRRARDYYEAAWNDDYASRVLPYLRRIVALTWACIAVTALLPPIPESPVWGALLAFAAFYPTGVTLVVIGSMPLKNIFAEKFRRGR